MWTAVRRAHSNLVDRLIIDQQLAVTVVDKSSRRIDGLAQERHIVRFVACRVVKYLQEEKAHDEQRNNADGNGADDITTVVVLVINHSFRPYLRRNSRPTMSRIVTSELTSIWMTVSQNAWKVKFSRRNRIV